MNEPSRSLVDVDPLLAGLDGPDLERVMPHRHRRVGEQIVISNDFGESAILAPERYQAYLRGEVGPGDPAFEALADGGFLAEHLDEAELRRRISQRRSFLRWGPNLHVMVVTLRCDHTCRYCHASRVPMSRPGFDMSLETAERVVDLIFRTPNRAILIEFQGGEPLANFDVVRHTVLYAREKNRAGAKQLAFALVTNLSQMDEEKLDFLVRHQVEICTSLDGPADLHDGQRRTAEGDAHQKVLHWIERINQRYVQEGLDPDLYRVEALLTVTRQTIERWQEVIDTYVAAGCRAMFLRALNPYGFAATTRTTIGYSMEQWLAYYRRSVDYMVELNRQGVQILERNAGILLTRIGGHEPNYLDLRSPCGAGIGQLAYSHDGKVFTCDEGRMVDRMGDDIFEMGDVREHDYEEMMAQEVVRSMILTSTLDALPGCHTCAYKPFCGLCPVHAYSEQGSLAGRVLDSDLCKKHMGILDHVFGLLGRAREDEELAEILGRWGHQRPREHFVHAGEES